MAYQKKSLGLCDPGLINQAIKRAGEVVPAFPVVLPGLPAALSISEAQRYSLVKAAKSPTKEGNAESDAKRRVFLDRQDGAMARHAHTQKTGEFDYTPVVEVDHKRERVALGTPGASCIIEHREWAKEYRVRTQVDTTQGVEPPSNSGPRITFDLSDRALRAMTDSAAYVAADRGGFTTFVTLTFNEEQRAKLAASDTSIQREVSRCLDAWGKMYKRGMKRQGIAGNNDALDYLWVVEVPKNEAGEDNPHCHLLMRWAVPFEQFKPWAARLEKAWGQGFAHIEKIHKGESAGAYIAKAAGYLCKAQGKSDQGQVRGNRYGISESARAPGWETITKTQIDCMGQLIADIYDHLSVKHGPDYKERARLNRSRQSLLEKSKIDRKKTGKKKAAGWITRQRKKIETRLEKVRAKLNALPVRCNQYQVILKGEEAFKEFMVWRSDKNYPAELSPWLPVKPAGVSFEGFEAYGPKQTHYFSEFENQNRLARIRRDLREAKIMRQAMTDSENSELLEQLANYQVDVLSAWEQYQGSCEQ